MHLDKCAQDGEKKYKICPKMPEELLKYLTEVRRLPVCIHYKVKLISGNFLNAKIS